LFVEFLSKTMAVHAAVSSSALAGDNVAPAFFFVGFLYSKKKKKLKKKKDKKKRKILGYFRCFRLQRSYAMRVL